MSRFITLTHTNGRAWIVNEDEIASVHQADHGGRPYQSAVWTKSGGRVEVMENTATIRMMLDHGVYAPRPGAQGDE